MTTKIEWTDATWNPATGCTKVSQGCKNCYAERIWPKVEAAERMREHWEWQKAPKRAFTEVRTHPNRLEAPLHWRKPRRVFVNSMSDLFHEDVRFEFVDLVFAAMQAAPQHKFQVLTKRPARMLKYVLGAEDRVYVAGEQLASLKGWCHANEHTDWPLPNVWLGVSVEDQEAADERIPLLLQTPSAVRFLSCEPLLGPIDLTVVRRGPSKDDVALQGRDRIKEYFVDAVTGTYGVLMNDDRVLWEPFSRDKIDWVIAGGESGPNARPSHPDWFRALRDQCAAAGVPYFFKQWGEWAPEVYDPATASRRHERVGDYRNNVNMRRLGKKTAGRTLDGRLHDEYPA